MMHEVFLQNARQNITNVLRNNRKTKVKLFFKCYMEKTSIIGEQIIRPADFHSDIEVNLDGTDEDELYVTMVERVLENMYEFQGRESSPWRLYSIIKLELHNVNYKSLRGETWIHYPKS